MFDIDSPENILAALDVAEPDLINMLGGDWPRMADRYYQLKAALSDEKDQWEASVDIKELFSPYEAARDRLETAILGQGLQSSVMLGLAKIASSLGLDGSKWHAAARAQGSVRFVFQKSVTNAKSIKLGNIDFDFGDMTELAAGIITAGTRLTDEVNYILFAAGILLTLRGIYKMMAVEIEEPEATVFYGFTKAANADRQASEADILQHANEARVGVSLEPLTDMQLRNALHNLAELKSILQVAGKATTWQIVERYHIKK